MWLSWAIPTLRTRRRYMRLPLAWSYQAIVSTTTRTSTSRSAMKRPGTSGFKRLTGSSLSIRKQSWLDMACLIPTARRVTSGKLDATSTTSTPASPPHRLRWSFTSGCFHCIPTASTRGRSGRLQKLRNRPAPTPGQPVTPDHGPDMSTIHLHQSTTSTPEQFVAGLTDFGPGRSKLFGNSADEYLKVHHRGRSEADVTEGSGGIWERLHYDWSDPNRVVLKTTDSNVWGGASGHTYTFTRQPNGTTCIDVVVVREGKNLKGRVLGFVLRTIGSAGL